MQPTAERVDRGETITRERDGCSLTARNWDRAVSCGSLMRDLRVGLERRRQGRGGEQELGPGSFPGLTHHAAITRQTASVRVILLVRVTVAVVSVLAFA